MDDIENVKKQLRRRAVRMQVGGFKPPESILASWFGKVNVGMPDEPWPMMDGKPMHALCQLHIADLPYCPPLLADIALITVFIGPNQLPNDEPNGKNWCLRAYESTEHLVPISRVDTDSKIKTFPMRPELLEEDFPCWDDVPIELPSDIDEKYFDLFSNQGGFKVGGWPTLIQSEIFWAPWNKHPAKPEYIFQIDSNEKVGWSWGDNGVGYFGRGTEANHKEEWALSWQCY